MSESQEAVVVEDISHTEAPAGDASERESLIKAVEASEGEEAADVAKAEPAKAKVTKVEPPTEEGPLSRVKEVLRDRETKQKVREFANQAKGEIERMRAEVEAMKAEAKRELEAASAEKGRIMALKQRPMEAIKELGWDRDQLVNEVVREGTPEWQMLKKQEQALDELRTKNAKYEAYIEAQNKKAEEAEQRQTQYGRQQVETSFLSMFPEDSAMRLLYDQSDIVAKGHKIADEYREKTGEVADLKEIVDYLEGLAAQKLAVLRQEQVGKNSAAKPKANGPRTLSATSASERRTSPKPIREMDAEEERDALKAAAADAMRTTAT